VAIPQPARKLDYYSPPPGGPRFGQLRLWTVTTWLIVINVAVFVIDRLTQGMMLELGAFSYSAAIRHLQLWRLITFQFLHGGLLHIFFNMLSLYYFGPVVETRLGSKRFLAFYLICGISGAGMFLILWRLNFVAADFQTQMIGASAGVFGVLVATVRFAPYMFVRLIFPPVVLRVSTVAWGFIAVAVAVIVIRGANAGGEAAHLGGAFVGWLLASNHRWLNVFDREKRGKRFWQPGDPAENFFRKE